MGLLYMIRHGQASFGKDDYDLMSELGMSQARILGFFFRDGNITFDEVYSGTLKRHVFTADAISQASGGVFPETIMDPAFNEFDGEGIFRGFLPVLAEKDPGSIKDMESIFTDNRSFQKIFSKLVGLWISGEFQVKGVETWNSFLERVEAGIGRLAINQKECGNVALVTSGGVIAAALRKALGLRDEEAIKESWKCMNASVSIFEIGPDFMRLKDYNNTKHLEALKDRRLLTYR